VQIPFIQGSNLGSRLLPPCPEVVKDGSAIYLSAAGYPDILNYTFPRYQIKPVRLTHFAGQGKKENIPVETRAKRATSARANFIFCF